MREKQMRFLVENYYTNLILLTEKQKKADYEIKITATYGHNTGGSKGQVNSKTENEALRHAERKEDVSELEYKILIVDEAIKILDKKEREVIEKIKIHKSKLSVIARELKQKRKYVFDTRNRAIKKMCEYIGGGEWKKKY